MIKFEQKYMDKDDKTIGYVKATLVCKVGDKEYSYPLKFDDKTRKRFNIYARSLGYNIGVVDKVCADSASDLTYISRKTVDPSSDDDLPF